MRIYRAQASFSVASIVGILFVLLCAGTPANLHAGVLNAEQVIRLKKAGAGSELISRIIESQAIARALVTVDGVVKMKQNDITDETIISLIQSGNLPAAEAAQADRRDRLLRRHIQRQNELIELQRERQEALVDFISKLINNKYLQEMVQEGKISSKDYRKIILYMKQYARDEPTYDFQEEGNIDIRVNRN